MEAESGEVQENRYDMEGLRFELLENGSVLASYYDPSGYARKLQGVGNACLPNGNITEGGGLKNDDELQTVTV